MTSAQQRGRIRLETKLAAPLLNISNLHAYYGKSHVLQGIDLCIGQGEIVSLLGRNGVGRSTLLKSIMGQVRATGSITFNGEQILGLRACQIASKGIGYVPENRQIFPGLSVEQNLLLGEKNGPGTNRPEHRWQVQEMYAMFPQLLLRKAAAADKLSGGEQQMLALCRTLMGNPSLIMIDEPLEGLAPKIAMQVAQYFDLLQQRGISILLIEQKLSVALAVSQRLCVMGRGRIVFNGSPTAFEQASSLRAAWLGV